MRMYIKNGDGSLLSQNANQYQRQDGRFAVFCILTHCRLSLDVINGCLNDIKERYPIKEPLTVTYSY